MVTINIRKRHLFVFCIVIGIVAGMLVAYAYNPGGTGGVPSNFGHSVDEIDWDQTIGKVKVRDIVMGWGDYSIDNYEYIRLNSSQGYIGGFMHSRTGSFGENSLTLYSRNNRNIILKSDAGNVGIGTMSPTAKLDVDGQIRIRGGSPQAGMVLTSDANGLATWQTPSGDITDVIAGTGLTGGGASGSVTLNANTNYLQRRVANGCPAGRAIQSIAADGTPTCISVTAICTYSGTTYSTGASCRTSACNPTSPPGCSGFANAWGAICQADGGWVTYCGICSQQLCGT